MHPDQLGERFCKILQSGQSKVNSGGHSQRILKVSWIECQTCKAFGDSLVQPHSFKRRKLRLEEIN